MNNKPGTKDRIAEKRGDDDMKKTIIGMLLVMALIASVYASPALSAGNNNKNNDHLRHEAQNGMVTLETDSIVVQLVGNQEVPFYFFWSTQNPNEKYKLQFYTLFEIIDKNGNGVYDPGNDTLVPNSKVALSSFDWEFSDFKTETDANGTVTAIHFNMTSVSGSNPRASNFTLQIRNHLYADNVSALKFDIVISNYTFKDDNADLVLGFKLILASGGQKMKEHRHQHRESLEFGNAYFETNSTAKDKNNTNVPVKMSYGEDMEKHEKNAKMVYLTYEHFTGELVHDPVIGVLSSGSGSSSEQTVGNQKNTQQLRLFPTPSRGELLATGIIATMFAIAIPAIIYKLRKR